eukprot:2523076-Karenia_brevis.AAC.1
MSPLGIKSGMHKSKITFNRATALSPRPAPPSTLSFILPEFALYSSASQSLVDGVRGLDREIAERYEKGEPMEPLERAKRLLNRLISSTNRRMHKGYPEMLSYLLKKPSYYCSHSFVTLMFHEKLRFAERSVKNFIAGQQTTGPIETGRVISRQTQFVNQAEDYVYRPTALENFPWYFFVAACEGRSVANSTSLPWHAYGLQKHPCYQHGKPVRSPSLACSLQEDGAIIREYPYYVSLRTEEAWRVPVLLGKFPTRPAEKDTPAEKGRYALLMMLLFRPWRGWQCADFLERILGGYTQGLPEAEAWNLIHGDYASWRRREIDEVASHFLNRSTPVTEEPAFDTKE